MQYAVEMELSLSLQWAMNERHTHTHTHTHTEFLLLSVILYEKQGRAENVREARAENSIKGTFVEHSENSLFPRCVVSLGIGCFRMTRNDTALNQEQSRFKSIQWRM